MGRKMADLPMELEKLVIASVVLECSQEILSIVAMCPDDLLRTKGETSPDGYEDG